MPLADATNRGRNRASGWCRLGADAMRPGYLCPAACALATCVQPPAPSHLRPGYLPPRLPAPWLSAAPVTCALESSLGYGPLKQVVAQIGLGALLSRRFPGINIELEFEKPLDGTPAVRLPNLLVRDGDDLHAHELERRCSRRVIQGCSLSAVNRRPLTLERDGPTSLRTLEE